MVVQVLQVFVQEKLLVVVILIVEAIESGFHLFEIRRNSEKRFGILESSHGVDGRGSLRVSLCLYLGGSHGRIGKGGGG